MRDTYLKINDIANHEIYRFIKLYDISRLDYTFEPFFNYMVENKKVKVMEHHFSDDVLLGITMVDRLGTSISYEIDCPPFRQNFTKCHELGHLILKHKGKVFAESKRNQNPQEVEADYFASFVLAPDIILLSKIVYQRKYFHELAAELKMSNQALETRLHYFLTYYCQHTQQVVNNLLNSYKRHHTKDIVAAIKRIENHIIKNYEAVTISDKQKLEILLTTKNFITNYDIASLENKEFQKEIKEEFHHIETFAYYEKGLTLWYLWNTKKLSQEEAKRKAKLLHYDLQNK